VVKSHKDQQDDWPAEQKVSPIVTPGLEVSEKNVPNEVINYGVVQEKTSDLDHSSQLWGAIDGYDPMQDQSQLELQPENDNPYTNKRLQKTLSIFFLLKKSWR
jgi:hypothetical protein